MKYFREMTGLELATVGSAVAMTIAPLVPYALLG